MTQIEIDSIKNKIAALRMKYSEKMGRIHKRKTHENEIFRLEMQAIQATCSHPEREEFGFGKHEECMICGKVWSLF